VEKTKKGKQRFDQNFFIFFWHAKKPFPYLSVEKLVESGA
jgi:hypothetical protein